MRLKEAAPGLPNDTMHDVMPVSYVIRRFNYGTSNRHPDWRFDPITMAKIGIADYMNEVQEDWWNSIHSSSWYPVLLSRTDAATNRIWWAKPNNHRMKNNKFPDIAPSSVQMSHHQRFPQYVRYRGLWWHESALCPTFDRAIGQFTGYVPLPQFDAQWIAQARRETLALLARGEYSMPHPDDDERTHRYVRSQAPWWKATLLHSTGESNG